MEQKILEILKYYEDNEMKADNNFVKIILTILRKHYHTEEQLKTFMVFNNKKDKYNNYTGGFYQNFNKKISINLSSGCSDYKNFKMKNIIVLLVILHEFEHVLHAKYSSIFWKRNFYIEDVLINLVDLSNICPVGQLKMLHDFIPDERLANIKSIYKAIRILSLDDNRYISQINELKFLLYNYIADGYNKSDRNMCSINAYIDMIDDDNKKRFYDIYNTICRLSEKESTNKRILYGLPIDEDEYNLVAVNYIKYAKLTKRI